MINRVLEAICTALLAVTVLIAFTAVIFRYVIGSALSWSFEASLVLLTYLTFIGSYLALRKHSHLKVDVFIRMLPPLGQVTVFVDASQGRASLLVGVRRKEPPPTQRIAASVCCSVSGTVQHGDAWRRGPPLAAKPRPPSKHPCPRGNAKTLLRN